MMEALKVLTSDLTVDMNQTEIVVASSLAEEEEGSAEV